MCPYCKSADDRVTKKGFFSTKSATPRKIQRFKCRKCKRTFSDQTGALDYRDLKPGLYDSIRTLICSSVSQRRIARNLRIGRGTVARKLRKLGEHLRCQRLENLEEMGVALVTFDEMETFEHTKCKPIAIAVAVERGSRRIIAVEASSMPAKGHLAKIAMKKYGPRRDDRRGGLEEMFRHVKIASPALRSVRSDQCPRYPPLVKSCLGPIEHETFKGRRGCVVGQGELKRGGFDPLFALNHTCAMLRDNLKRLSRRTWCTTKRLARLQHLLDIYADFHNEMISAAAVAPATPSLPPVGTTAGAS